jgi:hypothetical protein
MDTFTEQPAPAQQFSIRRVFLVSLISSLSLSALVAIFIFLVGNFGEIEVRLLLTTLTIGGYSLTGLCSSVLYDKRRYTGFALLGIVVAVIGFLMTVGALWEIVDPEDAWKGVLIFMVLSFSIAHTSLLLLAKSEHSLVNTLLSATVICIAIVAGMLINLIIGAFNGLGEFYYRLLGVFAVLDVLGTIVVPILRRVKS